MQRYANPNSYVTAPSSQIQKLAIRVQFFFDQLIKLAQQRNDCVAAVSSVRKDIQDFVRGTITVDAFMANLEQVFGSKQIYAQQILRTGIQHYRVYWQQMQQIAQVQHYPAPLQRIESFSAPPSQADDFDESVMEIPAPPRVRPAAAPALQVNPTVYPEQQQQQVNFKIIPAPQARTYAKPEPVEFNFDAEPQNESLVLNSPQQAEAEEPMSTEEAEAKDLFFEEEEAETPAAAVPQYVEPLNPLVNPQAILNFCNNKNDGNAFTTISPDGLNLLAEYLESETRQMVTKMVNVARIRTSNLPTSTTNDVKEQLRTLDKSYLARDFAGRKSNGATKLADARNDRKRDLDEANDLTNETAMAAIGGKRRNFGNASTMDSRTAVAAAKPTEKPFKVTMNDFLFVCENDGRLRNSWVYRNALRAPPHMKINYDDLYNS